MAVSNYGTYTSQTPSCYRDDIVIFSMPDNRYVCAERECETSPNPAARSLYNITKLMNVFFRDVLGLCGINGRGKQVPLLIGWKADNARWECTGEQCLMRFNDKYTRRPEVAAHEAIHGVVHHLRPLHSYGQSGALNESLGDVFGIAFKHWLADREGIVLDEEEAWQIVDRDLSQPISMRSFKTGPKDRGYVHDNSRIPSRAYYLSVMAAQDEGFGEEAITDIWFGAFLSITREKTTFCEFALKTVKEAEKTGDIDLVNAVASSWIRVGVLQRKTPAPAQPQLRHRQLAFASIRSDI